MTPNTAYALGSVTQITESASKTDAPNSPRAPSPCYHAEIRRFFEVSNFVKNGAAERSRYCVSIGKAHNHPDIANA